MSYNPLCGKTFEDIVECMLMQMGYNTKAHTTLHTRLAHILAEIRQPTRKLKLYIECKGHHGGPVGVEEVERFCHKVALSREKREVDSGVIISSTGFSDEAIAWCERNCSFVQLKSYKQLISFNARHKKLLRKFNN